MQAFGVAGAFIAFLHDVSEWLSASLIQCNETFRAAEPLGGPDGAAYESGETATWLLLFMREELTYS